MTGRICSIEGCTGKHTARGWCHKHWQRWWKHGDPLVTVASPRDLSLMDRLALRIDATGSCWEWKGHVSTNGYGRVRHRSKMRAVHRVVWEELVGPIPEGLQLDHLCRNTRCCNPDHLEPVTCRDNIMRGYGLARLNTFKTHCPEGHEYTPENTYMHPARGTTYRSCRKCLAAQAKRRRPSRAGQRTPCPHCGTSMHPNGLGAHIQRKHLQEVA